MRKADKSHHRGIGRFATIVYEPGKCIKQEEEDETDRCK